MLVNTQCVCGGLDVYVMLTKSERDVGRCKECGVVRTLQREDDYETLYTEGDRYHVERQGHIPYRTRFDHDRKIGHMRLDKFAAQLRWLDVGTANGGFVMAAKDRGYAVEGLELNPGIAAWAAEATGCTVHTGWDTVSGLFDVISLHDVLEHFADPLAGLHTFRKRLRVGGLLIIDVPDVEDPRFANYELDWIHLKPQEHLFFFSEYTLTKLLLTAGYKVISRDTPIPGKLVLYSRRFR